MDLLHLVDRLEELVAGAQKMPIGNRAILDRRRMLDLIDQMRIAVPHEVREAQDIVAQRDAIRREAEEEGRIIVAQAEERAADLVEEHTITDSAKRRAEEIAVEAERRLEAQIEAANRDIQNRIRESRRLSREQMEAADEYARELLIRLERQLQAFQNSIRAGVQQLEPQAPSFDDYPPLDDRPEDLGRDETHAVASRGTATPPLAPPAGREPAHEYGGRDFGQRQFGQRDLGQHDLGPAVPVEDLRPEPREDDGELENLLQPRRAPRPFDADDVSPPGVIDDFDHDPLDDDPLLRPAPRRDD